MGAEDLPLAQQLWGELEVTKYFGGPFSEDEVRKRFKHERARRMVHGFQYWIIELLATGEFVGVCGCAVSPGGRHHRAGLSSTAEILGARACDGSGARRDSVRIRELCPKKLASPDIIQKM